MAKEYLFHLSKDPDLIDYGDAKEAIVQAYSVQQASALLDEVFYDEDWSLSQIKHRCIGTALTNNIDPKGKIIMTTYFK